MYVYELIQYLAKYDAAADITFGVVNPENGAAAQYPVTDAYAVPGKTPGILVGVGAPVLPERETDMENPEGFGDDEMECEACRINFGGDSK